MKDSKVQEASFMIKGHAATSAIYLVEGLATGVSVWQALEQQADVLVCFSAGNLKPVAKAVRGKYPKREIIICADNDRYTPGNPGYRKALDTAKAVNGKLVCPTFPESSKGTDFNDLHLSSSLEEVARQLKLFHELEPILPKGLQALGLDEFISWPIPPREYLLYPILSEQGLALIYALRGLGKTYVALCIGLAVAAGRSLFNWNAELPHKVLYIDGEMPARTMQERLQRLVQTLNIAPEYQSNFTLITPDIQKQPMPNLATPEGQREIEPYLHNVALVIIDNIATLCRAGRENETESWLPVQGWLLDLRRRGISVLIVHHAGKNGDQRGTSAKEDIMDTVINLRRPKDYEADEGARFEVHLTKARGLCGYEAKVVFIEKNGTLAQLAAKISNKTQQEAQALETTIAKEFASFHSNLSNAMQNELDTMQRGIAKTIKQTQEQVNLQIKALNISFGKRWLVSALMVMSILLGLCLASWSIISLGEARARSLHRQVSTLNQQKQQLAKEVAALHDESWGISLQTRPEGRFIVLPLNAEISTKQWTVAGRPALKLE